MIRQRFIDFFNYTETTSKEMERLTGIDREKWNAIRAKRRRVNEDDIEAFNEAFPQFAYWLTTGKTIPEAGQISPEIEQARKENELKTG
ncbi:DNA-binding protein [Marinobacter sp. CA1]|nr:DNA-binding protein [Marinobacter sp. CA1]